MGGASSSDPQVKPHVDKLEALKKDIQNLQQEVHKLKESAPKGPSHEEIESLKAKVQKIREEKHHLKKQVEDLEKQKEMGATERIEHLKNKLKNDEENLAEKNEKLAEVNREITGFETTLHELKEELDKSEKQEKHLLEVIKKKQDEVKDKHLVDDNVKKLAHEITLLDEQIENARNQIDRINGEFEHVDNAESLESDINRLKGEIQNDQNKKHEVDSKIAGFEDFQVIKDKLDETNGKVEDVSAKIEENRTEKDAVLNEIQRLTGENEGLENQISGIAITPEQVTSLESDKENLKKTIDDLEDLLKSEKSTWKSLKHETHELREKTTKLESRRKQKLKRQAEIEEITAFLSDNKEKGKSLKAELLAKREAIKGHKEKRAEPGEPEEPVEPVEE